MKLLVNNLKNDVLPNDNEGGGSAVFRAKVSLESDSVGSNPGSPACWLHNYTVA